ncbi:hypothetical protein M9435_005953 [Picochlorum sp. BPE23]|nr:hypothetical protein M9435_005953 [Picochlorum sp. BPE23]
MGSLEDLNILKAKIDELEEELDVTKQVNQHLAEQLEKLGGENESYKQHVVRLNQKLSKYLALEREEKEKQSNKELLSGDKEEDKEEEEEEEEGGSGEADADVDWEGLEKIVLNKDWRIDSAEIELGSCIGSGSFGETWKANWKGAVCAVKKIKVSRDMQSHFERELVVLERVRHPHVLGFLGAVVDPKLGACWLVTEFMPGGNLSAAIRGNNRNMRLSKKPMSVRFQILADIASGMAALERQEPPIVHRDLKPSNVLLDDSMRAKVSDMGLAKILTQDAVLQLTPECGTYIHMAPEVIAHDVYGTQADVWSYATTAVEILTLEYLYQKYNLTPIQIALQVMDGKLRPDIPENIIPFELSDLLRKCFHFDALERPSFAHIADVMRRIVDTQIAEEKRMGIAVASGLGSWFGGGQKKTRK